MYIVDSGCFKEGFQIIVVVTVVQVDTEGDLECRPPSLGPSFCASSAGGPRTRGCACTGRSLDSAVRPRFEKQIPGPPKCGPYTA